MAKKPKGPPPPKRDKNLNVRVSKEMYDELKERSQPYGGISRVVRAMINTFLGGERNFDIDKLGEEKRWAKRENKKDE